MDGTYCPTYSGFDVPLPRVLSVLTPLVLASKRVMKRAGCSAWRDPVQSVACQVSRCHGCGFPILSGNCSAKALHVEEVVSVETTFTPQRACPRCLLWLLHDDGVPTYSSPTIPATPGELAAEMPHSSTRNSSLVTC